MKHDLRKIDTITDISSIVKTMPNIIRFTYNSTIIHHGKETPC